MKKPKLRRLLDRLLLLPAMFLVIGPVQTAAAAIGGGDFYVSGAGDDLYGDGSEGNPWRTITHAVSEAGGNAPTIHVGAGLYTEAAGESFPIAIDDTDALGISVIGPGDGTAKVIAALGGVKLGGKGGGGGGFGGTLPFLDAFETISGGVIVSGLNIEGGNPPEGELLGYSSTPFVLNLRGGAESVTVADNNVFNHALLDFNTNPNSNPSILIENNLIVNYPDEAIEIEQYGYGYGSGSSSSSSISLTYDLAVRGNTFIGNSASRQPLRVSMYVGSMFYADMNMEADILIEDNAIIGSQSNIQVNVWAYSLSQMDYSLTIRGNDFLDCEGGIYENFGASYCVVNRAVSITDNLFSLSDDYAISLYTSAYSSVVMDANVLIDGNEMQRGETGIYMSMYMSESGSQVDRDLMISNNNITGLSGTGVYINNSHTDSERVGGEFNTTIEGNTIRGNEYRGLNLGAYCSYTAVSTFNNTITQNDISFNGSTQVAFYISGWTGDYDFSIDMRGNVIRNMDPDEAVFSIYGSGSSLMSVDFQGGGTLPGFNTLSSAPAATSTSIYLTCYSSSISADINLTGNWWGTTSPMEIESLVYHGADNYSLAVADLSNPLPNDLDFTISQTGDSVKLTAGASAGFVPYAGERDIVVRVNGSAANNVSVAGDYGSLTFDNDYSGEIEVCVINPGGQSGCETSTVTAVEEDSGGGGGGGCGIIPVDGGPPTAKQLAEQYLLLLLPVLFLMRRRLRGQRPVPTGYAAA